ncbi:pyridoxal phosphate-dependent aminotransferase [Trinickia acidisoli]|uniref:pyridoxal phosphate-dependent aminotransferase n=1 Tax=Trinickia acidisoli TaxID=2767482 RepID=UPI001A8F41E7|nr:pyridoxal phosphate-dependent aminotransferase [Trinickia acidisoli]
MLSKKARALSAQGKSVINFASGDIDFPTPDVAIEAALKAARSGTVGYTNVDGEGRLKAAIASAFRTAHGVPVHDDNVIVSTGSKQALYNGLFVTTEPGDEVIIPAPYWSSYIDMAVMAGCTPVIVPCDAASGYKLTADALESAISPRTRWLILTSPSSPVGAVYGVDDLLALGAILIRHPDVLILWDELYEAFVCNGHSHLAFSAVAPTLKDRILTVGGVSKSYAMMGWRIGWGIGAPELIAEMAKIQSQITSSPSSIGQAAALAALVDGAAAREALVQRVAENRQMATDMIGTMDGLRIAAGAGGIYLFVDVSVFANDDRDFADALLNETGVLVLPGADCGASPYIRINIARQPPQIEAGMKRLQQFLRTRGR